MIVNETGTQEVQILLTALTFSDVARCDTGHCERWEK